MVIDDDGGVGTRSAVVLVQTPQEGLRDLVAAVDGLVERGQRLRPKERRREKLVLG